MCCDFDKGIFKDSVPFSLEAFNVLSNKVKYLEELLKMKDQIIDDKNAIIADKTEINKLLNIQLKSLAFPQKIQTPPVEDKKPVA
ncbi:hypothetical protein HHI36_011222 [Cryptolaemus montrouzieri]|uniref:Uncharacterized protein n=1 Tax=Cryptolaemus montrouzieri TaxID=559131 RepID=A0ABD2ML40_9CUCU